MGGIVDAGALLLGYDLAVEVARHALEIRNHRLDLGNLAPLLVELELLQADQSVTRLHRPLLPVSPGGLAAVKTRPARNRDRPDNTDIMLAFGFHRHHAFFKGAITLHGPGCLVP